MQPLMAMPHYYSGLLLRVIRCTLGMPAASASEKLKGDAKVVTRLGQKRKVWEKFGSVVLSDDTVTDYVVCFECEMLYKYDRHKTGTSNLLRHSCSGSAPQPNKLSSTQAHSEQKKSYIFFFFSGWVGLSAHIFAGWAGRFRSPNGLGWGGF